jgi:hypothetical protein
MVAAKEDRDGAGLFRFPSRVGDPAQIAVGFVEWKVADILDQDIAAKLEAIFRSGVAMIRPRCGTDCRRRLGGTAQK